MSDWQVGDLAVCVDCSEFVCASGTKHTAIYAVPVGTVIKVAAIVPAIIDRGYGAGEPCGCLNLRNADGKGGNLRRFRKIRPDEHQACEEEFVKLLKRSKRPVSA